MSEQNRGPRTNMSNAKLTVKAYSTRAGSSDAQGNIVISMENYNKDEHKPVTNSRDTQEIKYKKGIEMLKVFKNYTSKTSLLDDFMYYENRQKVLQEEKQRLLIKSYGTPVFVPVLHPSRKLVISIIWQQMKKKKKRI